MMKEGEGGGHKSLTEAAAAWTEEMRPISNQVPTEPQPVPPDTPVPATSTSTPSATLVITVSAVTEGVPQYDRKDWEHWTDANGDS